MATVNLTDVLKNDIIRNVKAPYQGRIAEAQNHTGTALRVMTENLHAEVVDFICEITNIKPSQYHAIPDNWVSRASKVRLMSVNGESVQNYMPVQVVAYQLKVPPAVSGLSLGYDKVVDISAVGPQFEKYAELIRRNRQTVSSITAELDSVVGAIQQLLKACRTLKQALEAYPPLEKWVPAPAMERLRTPGTVKAHAKAVREKVDLSPITTALLRQRIEG